MKSVHSTNQALILINSEHSPSQYSKLTCRGLKTLSQSKGLLHSVNQLARLREIQSLLTI